MRKKLIIVSLVLLFLFLPFSSWIVSLTGSSLASLFRDFLITVVLVLGLPDLKKTDKRNYFMLAAALFILWGILSFVWREASAMQWLKGFRFTFLPIILCFSLANIKLEAREKGLIINSVLISSLFILILASMEALGVKLPLMSAMSNEGALTSTHYVGESNLVRLQAVLAGPNAFGLYLLGLCSFALGLFRQINKKLALLFIPYAIFLVLTFSRSAIIGLVLIVLTAFFLFLQKKLGNFKTILITVALVLVICFAGLSAYQRISDKNLFTHNDSSSLRVEQYQRIWDSRHEIGILGRGSGTAGPSSQSRLDSGANHWTENIYLDIFEELGLIGLILYLFLLATAFYYGVKIKDEFAKKTMILGLVSFTITGIFINYYTGQAGIFLMWLAAGLALSKEGK